MTTKDQLITWLKNPNSIKVVLVEVQSVLKPDGSSQSFYLSNKPFVSRSTDNPSNTSYTAAISGGITFSESISLDGSPSIGYGDIALDNRDNIQSADNWLNYVWVNRAINILIGDAAWPRADFYNIFSGLIKDIDSSDRNTVNLILVNRLERVNLAISEAKVGGSGANSDQLIPLTFGECFNVTPLLIDAPNLIYQVHPGPVERIIEVRDNGAPLTGSSLPTMFLSEGKFQLTASPYGTITASVQGYKRSGVYQSKVGSVVSNILLDYVNVAATYSVTASTGVVDEGGTVTFTLTTTDVANGTVIPYTITGVTSADINGASLTGNFPAINTNTASVTFTITADVLTEGTEIMNLALTNIVGVSASVIINDTSQPVTATVATSTTTVSEGNSVVFTVTTNAGLPNGTLYWSTNLTNATAADFTDNQITGSVTIVDNTGTITRTLAADLTTEALAESFSITIRSGSTSGTALVTSSTVTITDSSQTPPATATITPSATNINESGFVTFTVATQNFTGSTLYWSTNQVSGTVTAADFSDDVLSGTVSISNGSGSFTRTMKPDFFSDGDDQFSISLSTTAGGPALVTSAVIFVTDSSLTPSASISANPTNVNEASTLVTFNITTTNFPSGTLYWTTESLVGTVNASDFTDGQVQGTVTITSGSGTVTRTISPDAFTESTTPEQFRIQVRRLGYTDTVIGSSPAVSITDSSQTPAISATFVSPASSINENTSTTFNITTTGVTSGTTLYWTISNTGGTTSADFTSTQGTFVTSGTSGSFNVATSNDLTTEPVAESFTLEIRTVSFTGTVIGSTVVSVADTSQTPITATFVSPASSINENTSTTFNITTTGVTSGTTLYWTISNTGGTTSADFTSTQGTFVTSGTSGSFNVATSNDLTTEPVAESFTLEIRTVSFTGTVIGSTVVSVADTSQTPGPAIVTSGLVLNYDAALTASYPGSGTTWFNTVGTGSNLTITGNPTYATTPGSFTFATDQITQYMSNTAAAVPTGDSTVEIWFKSRATGTGTQAALHYSTAGANDYAIGWNSPTQLYIDSFSTESQLTLPSNQANTWMCVALTRTLSTGAQQVYFNGASLGTFTRNAGSALPTNGYLILGQEVDNFTAPNFASGFSTAQNLDGEIGVVRFYNRVLTAAEIQQNYDVIKDRYFPVTVTWTTQPATITENTTNVYELTVSGTGIAYGTLLYWTIAHGTTTAADFRDTSGMFAVAGSPLTGSFSVTTSEDYNTETNETFTLQIRTGSTSGPVVSTLPVTVQNTSSAPAADVKLLLDAANSLSYTGSTTTWTDITGTGNATLFNGARYINLNNGAFTFDAVDEYMTVPNNISYSNGVTVSAWVYPTGNGGASSAYGRIVDKTSNTVAGSGFYVSCTPGTGTAPSNAIRVYVNGAGLIDTPNNTVPLNTWTFVTATIPATTGSTTSNIYINGALSVSGATGNMPTNVTTNFLTIGNRSTAVDRGLKGHIGYLKLHTKILTAQEALDEYNASKDRFINTVRTTNLAFEVDANNSTSYSGTGTTWFTTTGTVNVTLENGPAYSSLDGGSFYFDGVDDRAVTTNTTMLGLNTLNVGTIEGWVKPEFKSVATNFGSYQFLFGTRDISDASPAFYVTLGDNVPFNPASTRLIEARVRIGTSSTAYDIGGTYDWTRLANKWTHIAFVRNSNVTTLYVNGTQVATRSDVPTTAFNGGGTPTIAPFRIGNEQNNHAAKGNIALVRSYTAALTAANISSNYQTQRKRFGV